MMCYVDMVRKMKNPGVYTESIKRNLEHNQKGLEVYIDYTMDESVIFID